MKNLYKELKDIFSNRIDILLNLNSELRQY